MTAKRRYPTKEVDVDFLVFIERYATDLLRWDILTLFGNNPELTGSVSQIAHRIGRSSQSIRPELGDLALLGLLDKVETVNGAVLYRLTEETGFRRMAIKLAQSQFEDTTRGLS